MSLFGKNSCIGGSRSLTVIGFSFKSKNKDSKSAIWKSISFFKALFLPCCDSDIIISRIGMILSPSKNMCSVLQSPIPSAPNSNDFSVSSTVSAFALTANLLYSLHQSIRVLNSSDGLGGSVSSSPI